MRCLCCTNDDNRVSKNHGSLEISNHCTETRSTWKNLRGGFYLVSVYIFNLFYSYLLSVCENLSFSVYFIRITEIELVRARYSTLRIRCRQKKIMINDVTKITFSYLTGKQFYDSAAASQFSYYIFICF